MIPSSGSTPLRAALEDRLGARTSDWRSVVGGDIADSHSMRLESGERVFVKDYGRAEARIAVAEARGLEWLREADAIRVPRVLAVGPGWLALEWIDSAPPAADFDERLGSGLAHLHAAGRDAFGLEADNWIGRLPQSNAPKSNWATFYSERRLRPLRQRAAREGILPGELGSRIDRIIDELPKWMDTSERPARLHGDLWSGNVLVDDRGEPCLIDPAVYGGHREMDLAMMRLFGGFRRRVFEAYEERHPLAPGAESRIPLYQLYPLLVHVCLFGRGYLGRLASAVEAAERSD